MPQNFSFLLETDLINELIIKIVADPLLFNHSTQIQAKQYAKKRQKADVF